MFLFIIAVYLFYSKACLMKLQQKLSVIFPENIPFCSDQLPVLLYLLIRTVATIVLVALLLLVLRKCHSHQGKNK